MTKQSLINEHREFFPALHGLRGIAVLFVVFSHLGGLGLFLFPIPHDGIGKVGVWIFFVLSAFLLTKNLYQDIKITASSLSSTIKYVVHRIFRIYPLYIVVLILHVIRGHISIIGFIKHLALIQAWGELWAIPVEFQYYLLMPVIVIIALFLSKKHTGFLLLTATIASLLYGTTHSTDVFSNELNIIPKLVPFLLGSILSLQFYSNNNCNYSGRNRDERR